MGTPLQGGGHAAPALQMRPRPWLPMPGARRGWFSSLFPFWPTPWPAPPTSVRANIIRAKKTSLNMNASPFSEPPMRRISFCGRGLSWSVPYPGCPNISLCRRVTRSQCGYEAKTACLHGEYPIEVWHGANQCLSLSDEMTLTELIDCSCPAN